MTGLRDAGLAQSLKEVDFIEVHAFGCQPKSPNPLVDPTGFAREQERLRKAYAEAYAGYFATHLPDNGVPARFTVHVVDDSGSPVANASVLATVTPTRSPVNDPGPADT